MPKKESHLSETALYDKLFREISPVFLSAFAEKVLGLDIVKSEELKDKLQMTQQKETDSLRKVTDRQGNTFILQVETCPTTGGSRRPTGRTWQSRWPTTTSSCTGCTAFPYGSTCCT